MTKNIPDEVRKWYSKIGKKGGSKSKRELSSEEASRIAKIGWEKRRNREKEENLERFDIPDKFKGGK